MPLTDAKIRNTTAEDKRLKLSDGGGLYLLVMPSGGKWWRLKFRVNGKEKLLSLGVYPEVSLKDARNKRDAARKLLADGGDPSAKRAAEKASGGENTFKAVALEFLASNKSRWSTSHYRHIDECFSRDVFPWLGNTLIDEVKAPAILKTLRRIVDRGALETAARTKQFIGQAFRWAVAHGRAESDPTGALKGALPTPKKSHFAAITDPIALTKLLSIIDGYKGSFVVRTALQLAPLVIARPANLVSMEWSEINLDDATWRIPGDKMKTGEPHIVPLSRQAIALLEDIKPLSSSGKFVFPSGVRGNEHMSRETIGATLRRLGLKGEQTAHGFRTTASTILHEQGYNSDIIEKALAHAERNAIKAAYCHATYLPQRREMLQSWADYLDKLKGA